MRISGDMLQISTESWWGLEKKQVCARIQNLDSIELAEGRLWWLLILGISTVTFLVGIIFIVLFFIIKEHWIAIHINSTTSILFYKKKDNAKEFCANLLAVSRQLNMPTALRSQNGSGTSNGSQMQKQRQMT